MTNTAMLKIWKGVQSSISLGNTGVTDALPEALDLYDGDFNIKDESGGTWIPQIATLKNNGIRADSALQDGSDLIGAAVGNVIETITLYAGANITTQARMYVIKKLLDFARSSREFHTSGGWQYQPVYLEWQAAGAPGSQFALIMNMDVAISRYNPLDPNDVQEITLTIEREPAWRGVAPFDNPKKWAFYLRGMKPDPSGTSTFDYGSSNLDFRQSTLNHFYSTDAMPDDPLNIITNARTNGITGYQRAFTGTSVTAVALQTKWTRNYLEWVTGLTADRTLTVLFNGVATYDCSISENEPYTAVLWVYSSVSVSVTLSLRRDGGTTLASTTVTLAATTWTKLTITGTSTAGSTNAYLVLQRNGTTSATIRAAGAMVVEGSNAPVGYNTGLGAHVNSLIDTNIFNYDEALSDNVNYADVPGEVIAGDAPALAMVRWQNNLSAGNQNSLFLARSTQKDFYSDNNSNATSALRRAFNAYAAGDMTLGSSVAALTITKPVDATNGLLSNGSLSSRYVVQLAHTIAAITGHTAATFTLSSINFRNKYLVFLRGLVTAGTFSELSYALQFTNSGRSATVTVTTNYVTLAAGGLTTTLIGMIDFTALNEMRSIEGLGTTANSVQVALLTSKTAGAAVATFKVIDIVFMPYDEALMQLVPDTNIGANDTAILDNVGYFNLKPSVVGLNIGNMQPRGQYINLLPRVKNRVYAMGVPASAPDVTLSRRLQIDIVPRWYGVRDV